MVTHEWTQRLALAIANSLEALAPSLTNEPLSVIAVGCHPWHGELYLAILKRSEVDADPELLSPAEIAAWDLYACSNTIDEWNLVAELGVEMQTDYGTAADKSSIADEYLAACARAVADDNVIRALRLLTLDDQFRFSVTHPDDDREFVST